MDADWLGKTVSLDCGHLGYFQGLIQSIQIEEQTITITNAFQNGVPVQKETVTLRYNKASKIIISQELV